MIDPKYINNLSVFQQLMSQAPLKQRAKYGEVTQYYLTHTADERLECLCDSLNLPISFFNFIFNEKLKSDFDTLIARYRFWSTHIADENLLTPFFFDGILNHSPIAVPLNNHLDFLTATEPFKLFNLECIGDVTAPEKRTQYTSSFARMLGTYILFKALEIDLTCFKYWSFDGNTEDNLNSIGHSSKSILKIIIQQTRKHYGTHGFLDETLTIKYMANIVDAKRLIPKLVSGFLTNSDRLENGLRRILINLASDFRIDGIYNRTGFDVVMALYIKRYARWTSRTDATLMEDGNVFYTHRHSMINAFLQEQQNVKVGHRRVPESLDVPPSVFFKDYIKEYAKMEYVKIEKQYGTKTFEDMSKIFSHLDSSKYRYLDSPVDLILEGRNMSHCVGGSDYLDECMSGKTFILHYSDGSRFGYTIELTRRAVFVNDPGSLFKHSISKQSCTGYTLYQIKGHNNDLPSPEVERNILIDLFMASAKLTGKVGAELDRLIHQHKVSFRDRHPSLKDHTTCDYLPIAETYSYMPFKSINHQASNIIAINARVGDMCFDRGHQNALGWSAAYGGNFFDHDIAEWDNGGTSLTQFGQVIEGDWVNDTSNQVMLQQMRLMHGRPQRNPTLSRVTNMQVHHRSHRVDTDISLMYPHRQESLIGQLTLKDIGRGDLFETLFSKTISSVRHPCPSLKVFKRNTGREYLIGQSLFSLGELIISWHIDHGQIPLMVKLGMSILANKIRYGFMSEIDIVKILIRLANHGLGLFSPTVNWMADPLPLISKQTHFGSSYNPTYKMSHPGKRFNTGPAVVRGNVDIVHKTNLHRMAICKSNHSQSPISPTMNFDFNESFTRNLFGGYVAGCLVRN